MRIKLASWVLLCVLWSETAYAAVACTVLTQSQDTTNSTSFSTAAITPGANRLILLATMATRNIATGCTGIESGTPSGNGLTWVSVNSKCFSDAGAPTQIVQLHRSMGASPSTGAISWTYGTTRINSSWAVIECSGTDTSGTNGSGAVVQSATDLIEPGTSLTVTLAAFGSANNATLGVFGIGDNIAVTPGSGFSELAEQLVSDGGLDTGLQVEWLVSNDTTVDASWTSIDAGGIAIEIKAAAAAADDAGGPLWFH